MAYLQFSDYYHKQLILAGRLPYPYYYPYSSPVPNLSNQDCNNLFSWHTEHILPYYNFDANPSYDLLTGSCHNPCHDNSNNVSFCQRDPCSEKYDYYCYDTRTPYQDPSNILGFTIIGLVSNYIADRSICGVVRPITGVTRVTGVTGTMNLDINLSDPWGIVFMNDTIWIANAGSGLVTSYDLLGRTLQPVINVFGPICNISQPTGIVFNDNSLDAFVLVNGSAIGSSTIIVATRDGTINGFNCSVDPDNSIIMIDNSANNSVYTSLEIIGTRIYATDFYNQSIDVYDGTNIVSCYPTDDRKKRQLTIPIRVPNCNFIDGSDDPIPADFAPYNITNIGDFLYVSYAKQSPYDSQYELFGTGNGYINIFSFDGKFVRRFVSKCNLDTPWGMLLAPPSFGYPAGSIMVSNFGDGTISIFGPNGQCLGKMKDEFNHEIYIEGLRTLTINPNCSKMIYWTASSNNLNDATMGTLNAKFYV